MTYEELMEEIACMKLMKCDNLVRMIDKHYVDERFIYIVMEEFQGGELMDRLKNPAKYRIGGKPGEKSKSSSGSSSVVYESTAAAYVKQMLKALEYMSRKEISVVHRGTFRKRAVSSQVCWRASPV